MLLEGMLINVDGCLVVGDDDAYFVVFFPDHQVRYTRNGGVRLLGTTYHLGDQVVLTGGYVAPTNPSIPQACALLGMERVFTVTQRDAILGR